MAKCKERTFVDQTVTIELREMEARALNALVSYGADAILEAIREKISPMVASKHADGFREFFNTLRADLPPLIRRADHAREVFRGERETLPSVKTTTEA